MQLTWQESQSVKSEARRKGQVVKVKQSINHGDSENESQLDGLSLTKSTWLTADIGNKAQMHGLAEKEQSSSHMGNRDSAEGTDRDGFLI